VTKPRKADIAQSLVVAVVGNAAVGSMPIADGRLLPQLILDASARPEVRELIRVHTHVPSGDVRSQWGSSRDDADRVVLLLSFVQPMDVELVVPFSIEQHALLIETMLAGRGVYLQAETQGDRLVTKLDAPRVLVELPEMGFRQQWDRLLLDRMTVVMSRRLGVPRRTANPAAVTLMQSSRSSPSSGSSRSFAVILTPRPSTDWERRKDTPIPWEVENRIRTRPCAVAMGCRVIEGPAA
jgi:hypothetical protein